MGEEREDPQRLKRIAAAAYDYENDPRWADYWSNVLMPPTMASRSDVVDHFKRKFYQRYIDPDLVVESMSSSSSSQSARPSATSSSSPQTPINDQARTQNSGSTNRTSGTSATTGPLPTPMRLDRQTIQFSVNAWALEHVAKFLRRNFSRSTLYRKYMEEPCVWVESNNTTLNILTSHAEIGLGFLLIISLLSWQRNIIQTFMYWQLLKLMYHAPVTAAYHRSVWAKIGRTVNPFIHRNASFFNTPLSAVQRWWFR